jgi:hypothetical protein
MQVVRDSVWITCLQRAMDRYEVREPDDRCYRLANAVWKCKQKQQEMKDARMKRRIVVLDAPPEQTHIEMRTQAKICSAMTMSGKRCHFRAVCGDYCRKHKVTSNEIGDVANLSDIMNRIKM